MLAALSLAITQDDTQARQSALARICAFNSTELLLSLGILPGLPASQRDQATHTIASIKPDVASGLAEENCWAAMQARASRQPGEVIRITSAVPDAARSDLVDALGALARLEQGDARGAVNHLQPKLDGDRPVPLLRVIAALAQSRRNHLEDAYAYLQQVLDDTPADPFAWFVSGQLASGAKDFDRAASAYLHAVQANPGWPDAVLALGRTLILSARPNEAIKVLEHAAASWPASYDTRYRLGSLFKLLADQLRYHVLRRAERHPPAGVSEHQWRSNLAAFERRARDSGDRAFGEYVYALAQKPGDPRTLRQMAEVLRNLGRGTEARKLFTELGRRAPGAWLYPYRAAVIDLAASRVEEAISGLQVAHARKPDQADVLATLGLALLKSGQPAEARNRIELANAFEPFNPGAFNNLGIAHARLGNFSLAEQAFRRGLELRTFPLPRTHLLHTNLAIVLGLSGQNSQATTEAKRALFVFPAFAPAAEVLHELERTGDITVDYQLNEQMELFGELTTVTGLDFSL